MSSEPPWEVRVRKSAVKAVRRAPRHERERLLRALEAMASDAFGGDVRPLTDQPTAYRRRVGDWRIFFDVHTDRRVVEIVHVVRRTSTTY
jgi:mRNA-degrading endonuclease RelE of RelBE toxin-antitoxin system